MRKKLTILVLILLLSPVILWTIKYYCANNYYKNDDLQTASRLFYELDGFLDSDQKLKDCQEIFLSQIVNNPKENYVELEEIINVISMQEDASYVYDAIRNEFESLLTGGEKYCITDSTRELKWISGGIERLEKYGLKDSILERREIGITLKGYYCPSSVTIDISDKNKCVISFASRSYLNTESVFDYLYEQLEAYFEDGTLIDGKMEDGYIKQIKNGSAILCYWKSEKKNEWLILSSGGLQKIQHPGNITFEYIIQF